MPSRAGQPTHFNGPARGAPLAPAAARGGTLRGADVRATGGVFRLAAEEAGVALGEGVDQLVVEVVRALRDLGVDALVVHLLRALDVFLEAGEDVAVLPPLDDLGLVVELDLRDQQAG